MSLAYNINARKCLGGVAWMFAGSLVVMHSAAQYTVFSGQGLTRSEFSTNSRHQPRSARTKRYSQDQEKTSDTPLRIPLVQSAMPVFTCVGLMAVAAAVSNITSNTPQHHDNKGVVHALRARHNAKEHLPVLTEFFEGDAERRRNTMRERGAAYHQMLGQTSIGNKKAVAMQTGLATLGIASVAATSIYPNKDRFSSLFSNAGNQEELTVGCVYEAQDSQGSWWPVKVEEKNGNGSYKCDLVVKEYHFAGDTAANWAEVWPSNCRRVIRGDKVLSEHSSAIA